MSKSKLEKFAEIDRLTNVLQYPFETLRREGMTFPHKGHWSDEVFRNGNPIILELGCGRGEYTVELGRTYRDHNFIGMDIKGNRLWAGAKTADEEGLENVRFLRAEIEFIETFFAPGEISEIWLTFPDPQMRKSRRRLTSPRFMSMYRQILTDPSVLHLKTDSQFLFRYTETVAEVNGLTIEERMTDVGEEATPDSPLRTIQTYYEQQWIARGISIKYLRLLLDQLPENPAEPEVEIEPDSYRSYGRSRRSEVVGKGSQEE